MQAKSLAEAASSGTIRAAIAVPVVLFVDDEPNVTANFSIMFRKSPIRVLTVNSGRDALELLQTTAVDIIVSDEQMPDMPGAALLAKVRQLDPETVRIILTGEASLEAAIDAINQAGIFRFLRKPCSVDDLTACLREAQTARDGQRRVAKVESDGIPEAIQPLVFDPFFTTKDVGRGSGQGLAIAHSVVVERHGGSLELETKPGPGTQFFVRIPALPPRPTVAPVSRIGANGSGDSKLNS